MFFHASVSTAYRRIVHKVRWNRYPILKMVWEVMIPTYRVSCFHHGRRCCSAWCVFDVMGFESELLLMVTSLSVLMRPCMLITCGTSIFSLVLERNFAMNYLIIFDVIQEIATQTSESPRSSSALFPSQFSQVFILFDQIRDFPTEPISS